MEEVSLRLHLFYPRKINSSAHYIGSRMDPGYSLGAVEKRKIFCVCQEVITAVGVPPH
jgi:hypothetical protein